MEKLGTLYKKAENWREIQRDLPAVIKLSNVPVDEICKKAGISTTHFYHILKNTDRMKPKHFVVIFRAIIEADNFKRVKEQNND